MITMEQIRSVKRRVGSELQGHLGFRGIGIIWESETKGYVEVNVAPGSKDEFRNLVPAKIGDVEIHIAELGTITALDDGA